MTAILQGTSRTAGTLCDIFDLGEIMKSTEAENNDKLEEMIMKFGLASLISQSIEYNMVMLFSFAQKSGEIDSKLSTREL